MFYSLLFVSQETARMAQVGPGSYSQELGTLQQGVRDAGTNLSTAFASTSLRDGYLG